MCQGLSPVNLPAINYVFTEFTTETENKLRLSGEYVAEETSRIRERLLCLLQTVVLLLPRPALQPQKTHKIVILSKIWCAEQDVQC
jgi:hypothetical protein